MSDAKHQPPRFGPPTAAEFRQLHEALVSQLPELAGSWWRRVRDATRHGSGDELLLLRAEAEHRLEHDNRRRRRAVLDVLFKILTALIANVIGDDGDDDDGDDGGDDIN